MKKRCGFIDAVIKLMLYNACKCRGGGLPPPGFKTLLKMFVQKGKNVTLGGSRRKRVP